MVLNIRADSPPSKPLNEDAIAYTTAQKVAELLQIPYPDADDLTGDASPASTRCWVSPVDFRTTGYEVGDIIEIQSDTTMTEVRTITSIAPNAGHIQLNFTGALLYTHTTANNATVQSTQSFTNGKDRGVNRAHVETLIKRAQDRIDRATFHAWRPRMKVEEFQDFTTYKPFRRRYFNDYVGAVPLRHRNVREVLRLEWWKGDGYFEGAGAYIRLKFNSYGPDLSGDGIYICNGQVNDVSTPTLTKFASLTQGTTTTTWNGALNEVRSAEQVRFLINNEADKELTTGRPTVTDGVSGENVESELFATSNGDMGNGRVKISARHKTRGGLVYSVATSDDANIEITDSTPVDNLIDTNFGGSLTNPLSLAFSATDTDLTGVASFLECGLITIKVVAYDAATGVTTTTYPPEIAAYSVRDDTNNNLTICAMAHGLIAAFTTSARAEFTVGSVTTKAYALQHKFKLDVVDEQREKDWWVDSREGIIYFNNSYPFYEWTSVKVSYIYGEEYVEKGIENIATKMVALDLLQSDDYSVLFPEGSQNIDLNAKYANWQADIQAGLGLYREMVTWD